MVCAADAPIARAVRDSAAAVLGGPVREIGFQYWMDAAIFHAAGIPTVDFGPTGAGAHETVEWVSLSSVTQTAQVLLGAARRFCEAAHGAPVVVLRPGLLYGPGKRPPLARQSFQAGPFKLLLARRNYPLPLSYVDNVADAVVLALDCKAGIGQAFTIVDENVRQADYTKLYRSASGESWRPLFLPVKVVALAAWAAERILGLARRRSPVTYHQVRRATDGAVFDSSRAREVLGWQPRVSVRDGLTASFAS